MAKLTLSIAPTKGAQSPFINAVRHDVDLYFSQPNHSDTLKSGKLNLSWYDDSPVSEGVAITASFEDITAFDTISELYLYLRKKGYTINVLLGY